MTSTRFAFRRVLFLVLLLVLLGAAGGGAAAQDGDAVGTFIPAPCMFDGIDLGVTSLDGAALGFECGYVVAPLRHAAPELLGGADAEQAHPRPRAGHASAAARVERRRNEL